MKQKSKEETRRTTGIADESYQGVVSVPSKSKAKTCFIDD